MKYQSTTFDYPLQLRYSLSPEGPPGLVILLHGYQDTAHSMVKRLGWLDRELPFRVLAINGPFPVPIWTAAGFKEAYSWYFRDTTRDLTLVPPQLMADRLSRLLAELGLEDTPKVLVGFSQGGYLAPHLARIAPQTRAIIGLGCGFMMDAYEGLAPLKVHSIHGSDDKVIDLPRAQADHAELLKRGFQGTFHVEQGLDHRVDAVMDARVRSLALEALK